MKCLTCLLYMSAISLSKGLTFHYSRIKIKSIDDNFLLTIANFVTLGMMEQEQTGKKDGKNNRDSREKE